MQLSELLSEEGRSLFQKRLVRKSFRRGDALIDKGDSVSGAYFVLDGALRVFTLGANGKQATLYRIEPGETCVLALNSLFNDVLYPAWVEADQDTTIGILPGDVYRTLFSREGPIQDITVRALSSAVFGLMTQLENRHGQTLEQRLAGYLTLRADAQGVLRITQQGIAAEIGTSREVVARLLGQFADAGWVKTGRGQVQVLNVAALRDVGDPRS